ncbi:hypothetical protein GCM10027160_20360 [Streptomyces calidiresistens]
MAKHPVTAPWTAKTEPTERRARRRSGDFRSREVGEGPADREGREDMAVNYQEAFLMEDLFSDAPSAPPVPGAGPGSRRRTASRRLSTGPGRLRGSPS